jgi:hypothetical protein
MQMGSKRMPAATRQTVYRKSTPAITVEQVAARLREMERSFRTRWIGLMVLGAFATMFGPVVIGSIMYGAQFNARRVGTIHSWTAMVGRVAIFVLPVLFFLEWITRGKLFEDAAESYSEAEGLARFGMGRGMAYVIFMEVCLWGPRMVIAGTKKIAGQGSHARADRNVAAAIVHAFVINDGGMGTGQLYPLAGGRDDVFADVLAYLMFFDVIGISKKGDRAWLCSDAQKALKLKVA